MIEKVRIYHIDGDKIDVPNVDANEATQNHPQEWSREPWTAERRNAVRDASERNE